MISVIVSADSLRHGHYESLPKQIIEKLRSKGIPVIGDWMLRGVEYGELCIHWTQDEVTFLWDDLGQQPPPQQDDDFDNLI